MAEDLEFSTTLQTMLNRKQDWYNSEFLQKMLQEYRLLYTCVKNLYDMLVKKSLITPDPYRLDRRISEISVPDTSPFAEPETAQALGTRFSDYETMLDFICTYFRFTVDNFSIGIIKKLFDFNAVFDWNNLSPNNAKANTRALATVITTARSNSPSVIVSMISDCCAKSAEAVTKINASLNELAAFQRELYKGELRKDLFEHPEFNKEKAFSSAENELAEIKRLYPKVIGKKTFYNDLISEIIAEDQGADKEKLRAAVLKKLEIKGAVQEKKKKEAPNAKNMLIDAVMALGGIGPTLQQLDSKLEDNFDLLFAPKKGFLAFLGNALKKIFHIGEKERICTVIIKDSKTGSEKPQKIVVHELMTNVVNKARIYNGIGNKGPEFTKVQNSSEDSILSFLNSQISECQSLFTLINALDAYFKKTVEILNRPKVKGMQIELSAFRNSIINVNKKRGEYVSYKEETEQMKKLGITDNE